MNKIIYQQGDATKPISQDVIIAHVANNLGKWGKGFVLPLGRAYPEVEKVYKKWFKDNQPYPFELGRNQFVHVIDGEPNVYVANMVAQDGIMTRATEKEKKVYLDYAALQKCLDDLREFAVLENLSVQMPKIGAGLGGGDWTRIEQMIENSLTAHGVQVTVLSL